MSKDQRRTKFYFTEYVNHAIRFYLSTPERVPVEGKSSASLQNWMAAQSVIYRLPEKDQEVIRAVFAKQRAVPESVDTYCQETGADKAEVWNLVVRTVYRVARVRGLV